MTRNSWVDNEHDNEHNDSILNGLSRSLALIKFDREGNIVFVNQNFLNIVGYDEDECIGKHHSIFVDQGYARTEEYKDLGSIKAR